MTTIASDIDLTPEQLEALASRDRSVSLSAGAGCGKTFVLVERFLAHIDPTAAASSCSLDEIVAITFTDAAAREMRERLRARCHEQLATAAGPAEAKAWQRLTRSIEQARVSTIHSFCAELLREHYVEAVIEPDFRVLDAAAAEMLRLEAVDARLRQLLQEQDQRAIALGARFGLDRLRQYLAQLSLDATLERAARFAATTPNELTAMWRQFFTARVVPTAAEQLANNADMQRLRDLADIRLAASDRLRDHITQLASVLDRLEAACAQAVERSAGDSLPTLLDELRQLARVQGVCTAKDWRNQEDYNAFKDACSAVRDVLKHSVLTVELADTDVALDAAGVGLELLGLATDVSAAVAATKAERNQLEFDDLLFRTHRLLTDPNSRAVQRRASSNVAVLMVDEFQDTDPRQVEIVQAVCGDEWPQRGLFFVGDYKQSIYRFRDAAPRVFSELREALNPRGQLALTTNFRSQPAIIDFVNSTFHDAFELPYEPLSASRGQTTPEPAIEFLWSAPSEEHNEKSPPEFDRRKGAARRKREHEARWVARRIRQLLDSREPIIADRSDPAGAVRPLELGDIAILLRTLSDVAIYEDALRAHSLDYYLVGGHAFYAQQEIFDVLNLLRAVASRADEISLAGALRSPMFALADETLFWLVEMHGSLNNAIASTQMPTALDAVERAKVSRASATIQRLREQKDVLHVAELLTLALKLTGYDATILAEFLGSRKLANINKLVELARTHDENAPGDLPRFITQLSEFVVRAPKEPLAATRVEGDVIRIMTIHHAKGLEFPLVVLPDLERPRHAGAAEPHFHPELGPVWPGDPKTTNLGWELHKYIEDYEDRQERTRLFYVACTRAADYLMLSSSVDDLDHPKGDWLKLLAEKFDLSTGEPATQLPDGYAPPQIRVTLTEPQIARSAEPATRVDLGRALEQARELIARQPAPAQQPGKVRSVVSARRRFSFSRLTGELQAKPPSPSIADESDDQQLAPDVEFDDVVPRELGLLVHAALERIDLRQPNEIAELCALLAPQFAAERTEPTVAAATEMLRRFASTPRAEQLRSAKRVRREVEFILPWPRDGEGDGPYMHGFIDCLYQDATGCWRLLDYKTGNVDAAAIPAAAQAYEMQLLVYALACESALGVPPAECTVCFLKPGLECQFQWNDAAKRKVVDRVSQAIETASRLTPAPRQSD